MKEKTNDLTAMGKIVEYMGQGGCVAFEHGYERPLICYQHKRFYVTMADNEFVYGYSVKDNEKKREMIALENINKTNLQRLFKEMKRYERFCKTMA